MVPRGGIEPSPIQLKVHHFLNGDFPVYLPVDPALSSRPAGCDPVPPYPSRVQCHAPHEKDHQCRVLCAIQTGLVTKVRCPPKAKVTCSNRVGRATSQNLRQSTLRCPLLRFSRNELLPRKGRYLADRARSVVRSRSHAAFWNLMSGRNPARPASRTSMLRLNRLIFPFLISDTRA